MKDPTTPRECGYATVWSIYCWHIFCLKVANSPVLHHPVKLFI